MTASAKARRCSELCTDEKCTGHDTCGVRQVLELLLGVIMVEIQSLCKFQAKRLSRTPGHSEHDALRMGEVRFL